jgi:hypothetical protein
MVNRVLLYGKSVLITGLASALAHDSNLEILQGESLELTDFTGIDLILVDLGDAETVRALPRLCALPGVSLVGMDVSSSTLTLLSGHSQPTQTLEELTNALVHWDKQAGSKESTNNFDSLRRKE